MTRCVCSAAPAVRLYKIMGYPTGPGALVICIHLVCCWSFALLAWRLRIARKLRYSQMHTENVLVTAWTNTFVSLYAELSLRPTEPKMLLCRCGQRTLK
jgi:hypothetical protein